MTERIALWVYVVVYAIVSLEKANARLISKFDIKEYITGAVLQTPLSLIISFGKLV